MGCCSKVNYSNYQIKKIEETPKQKSKITRIIEGWRNLLFRMNESNEIIINRSKICFSCENCIGKICSNCGCFIPAKINSIEEKCPINKW